CVMMRVKPPGEAPGRLNPNHPQGPAIGRRGADGDHRTRRLTTEYKSRAGVRRVELCRLAAATEKGPPHSWGGGPKGRRGWAGGTGAADGGGRASERLALDHRPGARGLRRGPHRRGRAR